MVLALIILLVEVPGGVLLVGIDALFRWAGIPAGLSGRQDRPLVAPRNRSLGAGRSLPIAQAGRGAPPPPRVAWGVLPGRVGRSPPFEVLSGGILHGPGGGAPGAERAHHRAVGAAQEEDVRVGGVQPVPAR